MIILVSSLWVLLIAVILKPIGLDMVINKWRAVIAFVLVTASTISFVIYLLPLIFKKFYEPENWTIGKYFTIPFFIVIISSPLAAIATYLISASENIPILISPLEQLTIWVVRTSFISIFPTIIFYFIYKNTAKDQESYEAIITETIEDNILTEKITLSGNNKEILAILPQDFLYAEVLGNYVTIYYLSGNEVIQKALRTTLQQIIDDLESYPQFVRCHRSFIVNISNIINIKGNSHAYKLNLRNIETEVPVSKSYTRLIKEKLNL